MRMLNSRLELLASASLRMMLLIFAYYSYKNGALPTELREHFYLIVVFATTAYIYAHISKSIFLLIPKTAYTSTNAFAATAAISLENYSLLCVSFLKYLNTNLLCLPRIIILNLTFVSLHLYLILSLLQL